MNRRQNQDTWREGKEVQGEWREGKEVRKDVQGENIYRNIMCIRRRAWELQMGGREKEAAYLQRTYSVSIIIKS